MGKGYLWLFTVLSFFSAMVNTSALLLFSASLLSYFVPFDFSLSILSGFVAIVCLVILLKGHFKTLDALSKIIMATLVIATVSAVIMAAKQVAPAVEIFEPVSVWTMASVGFIVITMGWMPAPIEISSFTSLWLKRQSEQQVVTNKSALFDFNVGYFGSAILAIVFLALGALVFYGTDIEFKSSGIAFSHQLVSMYSSTIGEWSRYLIAIIAFFCIFGSTITVIDGYSRIMLESTCELSKKDLTPEKHFNGWVLFFSVIAVVIVSFFVSSLMAMLNFAMILAFMTTPIFALLNYQLLKNAPLPDDLKLGRKMKVLSIVGLTYLFSFLALFIYWKWMM
ncbi:MAG TPA: divalent metal cation transporter [Psychromonas hadalis]|nr:divalent metal cation transporter [Psychromonas hadalis]